MRSFTTFMSVRTGPTAIPYSAARRAIAATFALATSVFVGMQPVFTQVPPGSARSITATFQPAFAMRAASDGPDWPVPITIASKSRGIERRIVERCRRPGLALGSLPNRLAILTMTAAPVDPDRWYSHESGRQFGPVAWDALKARAETGLLRRDDFVWREGMPDWVLAGGVEGLFGDRPPPPPPPLLATSRLATPREEIEPVRFAGFWRRVAAFAIDYLVLLSAIFAVFFFAGVAVALAGNKTASIGSLPNVVAVILFWIYFAGMESSRYQATLGKLVIGIRVTDLSGRRVDFARASGRHFGKILSTLCLLMGFVMAAFTSRKQTLHDILASCLVVRGRSRPAELPDHEVWAARHWGGAPRP